MQNTSLTYPMIIKASDNNNGVKDILYKNI